MLAFSSRRTYCHGYSSVTCSGIVPRPAKKWLTANMIITSGNTNTARISGLVKQKQTTPNTTLECRAMNRVHNR
jgi:hypothetical protein